jgi:[acyl-carrier-protein] S-malonyltransferase
MGKDLAERFPAARDTFAAIDEAIGAPLSKIMWEGPEADLLLTHNTQPAILAHSAAVWAVVGDKLTDSLKATAGHSLGEYSAYIAAGSLTATDAATLVRRRGQLMYDAGTARPGAMAAVLGLATEGVDAACKAASTDHEVAVAANLNAPDQTVISGDPVAVERAGEGCKAAGAKRVLALKVSGAFHSPLMAPAVPGLREALATAAFGDPGVPVIANATATAVSARADALRLLADQLTAPVRWVDSMKLAASIAPDARFIEIGPGNVLSGLIKRIVPGASTLALGTAAEVEVFLNS